MKVAVRVRLVILDLVEDKMLAERLTKGPLPRRSGSPRCPISDVLRSRRVSTGFSNVEFSATASPASTAQGGYTQFRSF